MRGRIFFGETASRVEDPGHSWHFPEPANVIGYSRFLKWHNACVVRLRDLESEPAVFRSVRVVSFTETPGT